MRQRLGAEADAEQRRALVHPVVERLVLLVQPRVLHLVADVLVAAEHHDGVELARRRALQADVPLLQLVAVLGDHVGEELGPHERPVGDGEHAHQAVGIFSSSSSFRSSCAPAGAWATPFV